MSGVVLFVAAESRECIEWTRHWDDVTTAAPFLPKGVHWARAGKWKGCDAIAIANGAGWDRAYQAVQAVPYARAVCSIGYCGALEDGLKVGTVVPVSVVQAPSDTYFTALAGAATLESVDHIVSTAQEKRTLRASGASVVEMEAAGVARAAQELGIPFHCVRVVSDLAGETFANDFGAALLPNGKISIARLLLGATHSPVKRFGELIEMGRRTAFASKKLGEFLANCSF